MTPAERDELLALVRERVGPPTCFEIDGAMVYGDPNMSAESRAAIQELIAAARRRLETEHGMIPSIGRIVEYTLGDQDAVEINQRRDAQDAAEINQRRDARGAANSRSGFVVHSGNRVAAGGRYPLVITRVWAPPEQVTEQTAVNGQVLLDGNDTLWVTSRHQGDGEYRWRPFPHV